jgi:hypothetical protein
MRGWRYGEKRSRTISTAYWKSRTRDASAWTCDGTRCRSDRIGVQGSCTGWRYRGRARLRTRGLPAVPYRRALRRLDQDSCHRSSVPRYREHPGDDGDGPPGVPDELPFENAEPDPQAGTDGGCDRLYSQSPRASLSVRGVAGSCQAATIATLPSTWPTAFLPVHHPA